MVNQNLIADLGINCDAVDEYLQRSLGNKSTNDLMTLSLQKESSDYEKGSILTGKVISKSGDDAVVDVGLKSEGLINKSEFDNWDELKSGSEIEVMLESLDDGSGTIVLSKRKADRIRGWEKIIESKNEGDVVEGKGIRKIKGGILVDIGVPVFLPASQIDIRRPTDVTNFLGKTVRAEIIKIDIPRRNIVISRRKLIENEREEAKRHLMDKLQEGKIVTGTITNIADFGAFVDLGGLDGLLHITDMSWKRVTHPTEIVSIGESVEVKILRIDPTNEKVALGLKQTEPSPWDDIEKRFPVGHKIRGKVVSLVSYGAFVHIDEGIEGLVHVSEMSWTRRINHPNESVEIGDEVDVVVLEIDIEKQEISLGMKQTEVNPWELVQQKYPEGAVITGQVRNLANYGAFIEIEAGIDGLLHVSDISWTEKIAHPSEKYQKGDTVECVVTEINTEKQRIGLSVKHMAEDPWNSAIPDAYKPGMVVTGSVTKITNFGVFIELEDGLEGLLHISELTDKKVENPTEVVQAGQHLDVKILRVDQDERKIGLSLKRAQTTKYDSEEIPSEYGSDVPSKDSPARGGMDEHGALGTDKIDFS